MLDAIMVSGGFDPVHVGHLRLFQAAARIAPLVVALNSDAWLIRKKGFFFMPWHERAEILNGLNAVREVVVVEDSDGTVCGALRAHRPKYFGNGGDRDQDNTPERALCESLGITPIFGLGGGKAAASSQLLRRAHVPRPWGFYEVLSEGPFYRTKRLIINPGESTSNQHHSRRTEFIFDKSGLMHTVRPGQWHRLENPMASTPLELLEVQIGDCQESDIVREREYE